MSVRTVAVLMSLTAALIGCRVVKHAPAPTGFEEFIDIHGHVGTLQSKEHDNDISTALLLRNLDTYHLKLTLVSNIEGATDFSGLNKSEAEVNGETLRLVRAFPDRLRGLLWARPNDGSPAALAPFFSEKLADGKPVFVGVKLHPLFQRTNADAPEMDGYLTLCEQYHVPAVIHSDADGGSASPERIHALARRHPTVPVVMYHMGFFVDHSPAIQVARAARDANDADMYLEISECDAPAVLRAIEAVGADRVLFGSDVPYYGEKHYDAYAELIATLRSTLTADDFAKVMHGNATRLFEL